MFALNSPAIHVNASVNYQEFVYRLLGTWIFFYADEVSCSEPILNYSNYRSYINDFFSTLHDYEIKLETEKNKVIKT